MSSDSNPELQNAETSKLVRRNPAGVTEDSSGRATDQTENSGRNVSSSFAGVGDGNSVDEGETGDVDFNYKAVIWQVYSVASGIAEYIHEISWWKKILIALTVFTIGSLAGTWSFQFSPSAFLSWKEMLTVVTGVQGISLALAVTYAILKSESVKNFVQAWTEGTPVGTAVVENLGPEFERLIYRLPKLVLRFLPSQFQILYTIGNYFYKIAQFLKIDIVFIWMWSIMRKVVKFAAGIYAIVVACYTGFVLLFWNPLVVIVSVIVIYYAPKHNADLRVMRKDALLVTQSVLYNCCHALIWYYVANFVGWPIRYFLF